MEIFKNKLIACIAALCVFTSGISVLQAEAVERVLKMLFVRCASHLVGDLCQMKGT